MDDTEADTAFVSWLYFTRFEGTPSDGAECVGDDELFFEGDLNADSDSALSIFGCLTKTNRMAVDHIEDIYVSEQEQCDEGYLRASQDLNEGNEGALWLCFKKARSQRVDGEIAAIVDVTFVREREDAISEGAEQWDIAEGDVNPDGVALHLAVRRGSIVQREAVVLAAADGRVGGEVDGDETAYLGVALAVVAVVAVVIALAIWKSVCWGKGMRQHITESLDNEYGATLELSSTNM